MHVDSLSVIIRGKAKKICPDSDRWIDAVVGACRIPPIIA